MRKKNHTDDQSESLLGDEQHERVADASQDEIIADLEEKLADAEGRAIRALADFQNFQRRAANNEIEASRQGVSRVVSALLPVMDNFDLALGQDISNMSAEQLLGGVEIVRAELLRALENQGVSTIIPNQGDEFDPEIHEAVARHSDGQTEPGHIIESLQTGYKLGGRVLRPAKVVIAEAGDDDGEAG
ncbi:MAG TPA: nucleotide exchange factor GrpE [Phycisphaerales bacterium]|nr:nucleotide exchange factor GrpE [Phycisphaerales bacterium]